MNMKKRLLIALTLITILVILVYSTSESNEKKVYYQDSDEDIDFWFSDMENLIDSSEYILVCEASNPLNSENIVFSERNGEPIAGFTATKVTIKDIIKSNDDLEIGNDIFIAEEYFISSEKNKSIIIKTLNGCRPMNSGESYLLFLNTNNWNRYYYRDRYQITGYYQGKFPLKYVESDIFNKADLEDDEVAEQNKFLYYMQLEEIRNWFREQEMHLE